MGIRLYFRNKDKTNNEYCLGKLYYYWEETGLPKLESVKYLEQIGALDHYVFDLDDYGLASLYSAFLLQCSCYPYMDYGDEGMFELSTGQLMQFVMLYIKDHAKAWEHPVMYSSIENIIEFVEANETCEPIWEFRLGA